MEDLFQNAEAAARTTGGPEENQEEKNKNAGGDLLTPAPAHSHDRNVSIGGVRTISSNQQDQEDEIEDLFKNPKVETMSDEDETPGGPDFNESHNRGASFGGARQLIDIECDSFDEEENSPDILDGNQDLEPMDSMKDETKKELDKMREENNDLRAVNSRLANEIADLQKAMKDNDLETERAAGSNLEIEHNKHERCISQGGLRPLQDYGDVASGLDELGDKVQGSKPRELFDGQGTVADPSGHERRRSNLQDGRELFEDKNVERVSNPFGPMRGDTFREVDLPSPQKKDVVMKDLTREHLQLKMSKIELIKTTAEEIDRLRGIIKALASQLKHINEVHNKLLNTTLGNQMLGSVSGVFGAVTGFFSASEPAPDQSSRD